MFPIRLTAKEVIFLTLTQLEKGKSPHLRTINKIVDYFLNEPYYDTFF